MLVGNANDHLPFDVLGHIFSYYASEENIKYPLETLLLVCRSWSHSALGHRALWKHLKIYIGHEPTPTIWTTRLPLRLARCGPDIDLDVDLRNLLYIDTHQGRAEIEHLAFKPSCNPDDTLVFHQDLRKGCSCYIAASACAKVSLQALTGSNGEICARWRSFTLYLGGRQYDEIGTALSHATPILENLELGNVRFSDEVPYLHIFPQVHSLKRLSLLECELPSLPRCENLLDVSLHWEQPYDTYPDFSSLRKAQKLQSLSLRTSFDAQVRLPGQLPDLRVLRLEGYISIDRTDIFNCQMPQVSHLSLEYEEYDLLNQMLQCQGFSIEKLTRLSLGWESKLFQAEDEILLLMDSLRAFLTRARDLQHLDASDDFLPLVIKVLWNSRNDLANPNLVRLDDSVGPVFKDVCLTNTNYGCNDSVQFDGSETTSFLEELATKWSCFAPNVPDEQLVQEMVSTSLPP
jgi:F-box-like